LASIKKSNSHNGLRGGAASRCSAFFITACRSARSRRNLAKGGKVEKKADPMDGIYPQYRAIRSFSCVQVEISIPRSTVCKLVTPAVYDCPDSLLEEAAEYNAA
jgi:hypothetical protein